jgi:lysophospholipase L1-like esterase
MKPSTFVFALATPLLFLPSLCTAVPPSQTPVLLPKDARLAIVGDSITEQKLYSKYVETYLLAVAARPDVHVFQFGWGGETAGGFANRMQNDLSVFTPTVATLCYGMNDGAYHPYDAATGKRYEDSLRTVLTKLVEGKVHAVVGTPGAVDSKYFVKPNFGPLNAAASYNESLANLGRIGKKLSAEFAQSFADVHTPMIESMAKGKAVLGEDYDVCGRDGVHPGANGQLAMAYAFLLALGCDGQVGEIILDFGGAATASPGHKVLAVSAGKIELESLRYPFCFEGDSKSSAGTRSILPFLPFNDALNRFTLKVANVSSARAKVTWGEESREFTREQLAAGINLASEFSKTPFDDSFKGIMNAVATKQAYETNMIKGMISNFRSFSSELQNDPEMAGLFEGLRKKFAAKHAQLDTGIRAALLPVKHTITVRPL